MDEGASLVHDLSAKTAYRRQFIVKKQEIITRNADLESINRYFCSQTPERNRVKLPKREGKMLNKQ